MHVLGRSNVKSLSETKHMRKTIRKWDYEFVVSIH